MIVIKNPFLLYLMGFDGYLQYAYANLPRYKVPSVEFTLTI